MEPHEILEGYKISPEATSRARINGRPKEHRDPTPGDGGWSKCPQGFGLITSKEFNFWSGMCRKYQILFMYVTLDFPKAVLICRNRRHSSIQVQYVKHNSVSDYGRCFKTIRSKGLMWIMFTTVVVALNQFTSKTL